MNKKKNGKVAGGENWTSQVWMCDGPCREWKIFDECEMQCAYEEMEKKVVKCKTCLTLEDIRNEAKMQWQQNEKRWKDQRQMQERPQEQNNGSGGRGSEWKEEERVQLEKITKEVEKMRTELKKLNDGQAKSTQVEQQWRAQREELEKNTGDKILKELDTRDKWMEKKLTEEVAKERKERQKERDNYERERYSSGNRRHQSWKRK